MQRTWKDWAAVVGVAVLVAVAAFYALMRYQHLAQDEANVHGLVQLINYNIAKGHLELVPTEPAPVAAPPAAAPKPVEPPKK